MQAMNGFGGLGVRRLFRLVGCVAALIALSAMAVPSIASASKKTRVTSTYLSLGDSLAFGYSQQLFNENLATGENPASFEHGFANDYLALVNGASKTKKGQLVNDGCPGETSASLIGDNATLLAQMNAEARKKISEPITGEAPCAYHYTDGLPLHHEYGGKSQLESAIATIKEDQAGGRPVRDISLDIGANDELHEVAAAEKEAKEAVEEKVGAIVTPEAEAIVGEKINAAVAAKVVAWLEEKVGYQAYVESNGEEPALKEDFERDAGEYLATHAEEYSEFKYHEAAKYLAEHGEELEAEGKAEGERLAYEYAIAHAAELQKEGDAIGLEIIRSHLGSVFEQIDTNVIGILTALRHAGFNGDVTFEQAYDPYGRVKGLSVEHAELEPGFNEAAAELAGLEQTTVNKKSTMLKVCFSDAETRFNPAVVSNTTANEELEEERLQQWTNMANFTPFEYAPGKVLNYDEKEVEVYPGVKTSADGPDIHATPKGYEVMAEQMKATCKYKS
ncbi:MAG: hypothetical protein ACRDJX_08025 [Solirubrobacteraceae bacterium]